VKRFEEYSEEEFYKNCAITIGCNDSCQFKKDCRTIRPSITREKGWYMPEVYGALKKFYRKQKLSKLLEE